MCSVETLQHLLAFVLWCKCCMLGKAECVLLAHLQVVHRDVGRAGVNGPLQRVPPLLLRQPRKTCGQSRPSGHDQQLSRPKGSGEHPGYMVAWPCSRRKPEIRSRLQLGGAAAATAVRASSASASVCERPHAASSSS